MSLLLLSSCETVTSLWKGDLVAVVGKQKLYRSQVEKYIPVMANREDSAKLAAKYIDSWAADRLYMKVASEQLSKEEMDVTEDLEAYRRILIKHRYEQKYISSHLDTLVTQEQLEAYHKEHSQSFVLKSPILKFRYADIMKDSPNKEKILEMLSSEPVVSEELASSTALRFIDSADGWTDARVLAGEFGLEPVEMIALKKDNVIKYEPEGRGDMKVAYVFEFVNTGCVAPIEYCSDRIRDIILSERRHLLLEQLDRDILEDARKSGLFKTLGQ